MHLPSLEVSSTDIEKHSIAIQYVAFNLCTDGSL